MEKLVHLSLSESHGVVTQIQVHNIARVLVETVRQSMHVLCRKTTPGEVQSAHKLLGVDDPAQFFHYSAAIQVHVGQLEALEAVALLEDSVEKF